MSEDPYYLLRVMMDAAVTLRVMELEQGSRPLPDPFEEVTCLECGGKCDGCFTCGDHGKMVRRDAYAYYIASHGDDLLFQSKEKGKTAKVFNVVAEGLAMLAFQPGGVSFAGSHYEAKQERTMPKKKRSAKEAKEAQIVRKTEPTAKIVRKPK